MSYTITKFVLDLPLSPSEKAVAHSLAYHAHEDGGQSFPSIRTIANEAGLKDRRFVQRLVRRLEDKGIIVAESSKAGGRAKSVSYRFDINSGQETAAVNTPQGGRSIDRSGSGQYTARKVIERSEKGHGNDADASSFSSWEEMEEYAIAEQMYQDELQNWLNAIPLELNDWVANLKPLSSTITISPDQFEAAFKTMDKFINNGYDDYHRPLRSPADEDMVRQLDETYGIGTSAQLAEKIGSIPDADIHRWTGMSWLWGHLAGKLMFKTSPKADLYD